MCLPRLKPHGIRAPPQQHRHQQQQHKQAAVLATAASPPPPPPPYLNSQWLLDAAMQLEPSAADGCSSDGELAELDVLMAPELVAPMPSCVPAKPTFEYLDLLDLVGDAQPAPAQLAPLSPAEELDWLSLQMGTGGGSGTLSPPLSPPGDTTMHPSSPLYHPLAHPLSPPVSPPLLWMGPDEEDPTDIHVASAPAPSSPSPAAAEQQCTGKGKGKAKKGAPSRPKKKRVRHRKLVSELTPEQLARTREVNRRAARRHRELAKQKRQDDARQDDCVFATNAALKRERAALQAELARLVALVRLVRC